MRRALVTGATGGLGRTLVPMLVQAGYDVTATGRNAEVGSELAAGGARFVAADLLGGAPHSLVRQQDVVFHLAALSSPWGRPADFAAINVRATQALLDAARDSGCGAFVYASTPSIYASPQDRLGLIETSAVAHPFANDYAATKYAAEQLVLAAHSPAFQTVALRPRAIVGPHDTVLLPRLLRAARRGRMPLPNGGRALIELTDVRDAAAAFLAADRHLPQAAGHALNISGGQPRRLDDLLRRIFARRGMSVRLVPVPARPALTVARMMELVCAALPGRPEPPATRYTVMSLAYSQTFNLSAAHELLGWAPRFSPEEAIDAALDATGGTAR
jgi:nucleoside-diphosphate-sugar epimerase